MRKTAFDKLKIGDRVIVNGTQDDRTFSNEPGVILRISSAATLTVKFDKWDRGWGGGESHWSFYADEYRKFNITVIPEAPKVEPKVSPVVVDAPKKKRPHGKQEYRGNGKHDWEEVTRTLSTITQRLRVPGGWVYRDQNLGGFTKAQTFVPVPQAVGYAV